MNVVYETRKDLPCKELYELFYAVGWSDRDISPSMLEKAVLPEYQHKGIGKELVRRCRETFPDSEWLVQTETAAGFYEKIGFSVNNDIFLTIPCKWF